MSESKPPKSAAELVEKGDDYENVNRLERLAKAQGFTENAMGGLKGQRANIPGICRDCEHATIITRGQVEHQDTRVLCGVIGKQMPHDVSECTEYWKRGQMSLREMQEIAWFVDNRPPVGEGTYR